MTAKKVRNLVDRFVDLSEGRKAMEYVTSAKSRGKMVIKIGQDGLEGLGKDE